MSKPAHPKPDSSGEPHTEDHAERKPLPATVPAAAEITPWRRVLRIAAFPFVLLAAFVLWFEEWLWEPMARFMRWVGSLPIFRQIEAMMRQASPYLALCFFVIPVIAILPFKVGGLWLIARHHVLPGALVFVGAKIVGTAMMAWILSCTKPALMQLSWFQWCWNKFESAKHWLFSAIRQHPLWVWIKTMLANIRQWIKRLTGR